MPRTPTRTPRLEVRVSPGVLAVLKRAADIKGRSVSDFVIASAQEVACRTIEETTDIRLSLEDQRRFVERLLDPPPPSTPALERASQAHADLIQPG